MKVEDLELVGTSCTAPFPLQDDRGTIVRLLLRSILIRSPLGISQSGKALQ